MVGFAGVLAHQGGWDELLVVAVPVGLFVALLRVANARAAALEDRTPDTDATGQTPGVTLGPDDAPTRTDDDRGTDRP